MYNMIQYEMISISIYFCHHFKYTQFIPCHHYNKVILKNKVRFPFIVEHSMILTLYISFDFLVHYNLLISYYRIFHISLTTQILILNNFLYVGSAV